MERLKEKSISGGTPLGSGTILGVYKPKGPSSFAMIAKIRRLAGVKKVGHAGTLDPLASGVLVVAIGREATKKLAAEVAKEKEYIAIVKLGVTSSTDDEEGEKHKITKSNNHKITKSDIEKIILEFIGKIEQQPPIYSALKIKGQPAYKLARRGMVVTLKPRLVEIKTIEIIKYRWPFLRLRVVTGPGVYIRALARDLGEKLGVGAYLADLERTRVGAFTLAEARRLDPDSLKPAVESNCILG